MIYWYNDFEEALMTPIDKKTAALLVMDFQNDVVPRLGEHAAPLIERTAGVVAAARSAGIPIVYVVVGFRPGYPEVSAKSPLFSLVAGTGRFLLGTPGAEVVDALRPHDGDVVIVKHRVGAFQGTDLEMVLRARGIDTLLHMGIATSGVVLSTMRHAGDCDYRQVLVEDCCADPDEEVHRVLTKKVLSRHAEVVTAAAMIEELKRSP
jgi:nicotinamidase-related amidase